MPRLTTALPLAVALLGCSPKVEDYGWTYVCTTCPDVDEPDQSPEPDVPWWVNDIPDLPSEQEALELARTRWRTTAGFDARELGGEEAMQRLLWSRRLLDACPGGPVDETPTRRWSDSASLILTDSHLAYSSPVSCEGGDAPADGARYLQRLRWNAEDLVVQSERLVPATWDGRRSVGYAHARIPASEFTEDDGFRRMKPAWLDLVADADTRAGADFLIPDDGLWPVAHAEHTWVADDWLIASIEQNDADRGPESEYSGPHGVFPLDTTTWLVRAAHDEPWQIRGNVPPPVAVAGMGSFGHTLFTRLEALDLQHGFLLTRTLAVTNMGDYEWERVLFLGAQVYEAYVLDDSPEVEFQLRQWNAVDPPQLAPTRGEEALASFAVPAQLLPFRGEFAIWTRTEAGWSETPELFFGPTLHRPPEGPTLLDAGTVVAREDWAFAVATLNGGEFAGGGTWVLPFNRREDGWHCLGAVPIHEVPGRPGRPAFRPEARARIAMQDDAVLLMLLGDDPRPDEGWQNEVLLYAFRR